MDKLIGISLLLLFGIYAINNHNQQAELKIKYQVLQEQHQQQTLFFNGYREGNTAN
jgi:hypothetical protein